MKTDINMSFEELSNQSYHLRNIILAPPVESSTGEVIDPWKKDLTQDEKNKILDACSKNIWYFLRYVVKVKNIDRKTKTDHPLLDFHLNTGTAALIYLYKHKQSAVLLGIRQALQKTTTLTALFMYQILFGSYDDASIYISMNKNMANYHLDRIVVPDFIRMKKFSSCTDFSGIITTNTHRVKYSDQYNHIYFVDDFMHQNYHERFFNKISEMKSPYYGVGTIGPFHADILQKAILFNDNMYEKDIEKFEKEFKDFTGYRPSYLILLGIDNIDNEEVTKMSDNFKKYMGPDATMYRTEFEIIPDWKM